MSANTIPEYRIVEDKFAASYLAGLQRQKRLNKYLNQVYAPTSSMSQANLGKL